MKYKKNIKDEIMIRSELKRCADEIASIDLSMQTIKDLIQNDEKMLQIGTFFIRIYEKNIISV